MIPSMVIAFPLGGERWKTEGVLSVKVKLNLNPA